MKLLKTFKAFNCTNVFGLGEGGELTKPHIGPNTTRESFERWINKHLYGVKKKPDWVKY